MPDTPNRSILVGISPNSEGNATLHHAAALARRDGARLTLLCARPEPPPTIWLAPALLEDPRRALERACAARLHAAASALPRDLSVVTLLRRASPARALLAEARRGAHDLVVVGAGRLAAKLRRRSPVPVVEAPVGNGEAGSPKGRVVFLLRLKPGAETAFLAAYEAIRHEVAAGVPGHVVDQVCRLRDDPDSWLITSEWSALERFLEWERSPEHRTLAAPLRACIAEARSLKFDVVAETAGKAIQPW